MRTAAGFFSMKCRAVPANSNKKWTPDEDKRLLELQAAGKSNFLIAAELRRSSGAVSGRLSVLKARQSFPSNSSTPLSTTPPRRRWKLDDDEHLMELKAKGASRNEIAKALGRTEGAIEQRIHTLRHQAVKP
jgi:DNA-binding NarL/FixJ family response regulator